MSLSKQLVFRLNDNGVGPELLRDVFVERGWIEFDEDTQEEFDWNIWWKTSRFRNSEYEQILPWQRLNHYPKTTGITKKDSLARNLKRMKGVYGPNVYNFSPLSYNVPNDYTRFVSDVSKQKQHNPDQLNFWICKPADLSRGRGIFLFKDINQLQYDCTAVVQKYIQNPLLISGYKFDIRIYVCVSSFHPLYVYIYQEGLVRFSTEKFDLSSLTNVFSHLTNTSINKHGPMYTLEKERVGPGCKWTLTQLRYYLHQANIDDRPLFAKIENLIILTLLAQIPQVPKINNCFELYGFDILIDDQLKPWLLEVNFSPALGVDCVTDVTVKKPLVNDVIDMLNFKIQDADRGGSDFKKRYACRMFTGRPPRPNSAKRPVSKQLSKKPAINPNGAKLPSINLNGNMSGSSEAVNTAGDDDLSLFSDYSAQTRRSLASREAHSRNASRSDSSDTSTSSSTPRSSNGTQRSLTSKSGLKRVDSRANNLHTIVEGRLSRLTKDLNGNDLKMAREDSIGSFHSEITMSSLPPDSADSLSFSSEEAFEKQAHFSDQRKQPTSEKKEGREKKGQVITVKQSSLSQTKQTSHNNPLQSRNFHANSFHKFKSDDIYANNKHFLFDGDREKATRSMSSLKQMKKTSSFSKLRLKSQIHNKERAGMGAQGRSSVQSPDKPHGGRFDSGDSQKPHIKSGPRKRVGDFYLVYPLSEPGRGSHTQSLDIRAAVRELQQKLNSVLGKGKVPKSPTRGGHMRKAAKADEEVEPTLWAPIKPEEGHSNALHET